MKHQTNTSKSDCLKEHKIWNSFCCLYSWWIKYYSIALIKWSWILLNVRQENLNSLHKGWCKPQSYWAFVVFVSQEWLRTQLKLSCFKTRTHPFSSSARNKKHTRVCVIILWQTFADYLFAAVDTCRSLALFQKNLKNKQTTKTTTKPTNQNKQKKHAAFCKD